MHGAGAAADLLQAAYLLLEVRDAVKVTADEAHVADGVLVRQPGAGPPNRPPALTTAGRGDLHKQGVYECNLSRSYRTVSVKLT